MPVFSSKHRLERGFTLLEAVIFIAIGGVIIPMMLVALGIVGKRNAETLTVYRDAAIADSIIKKNIETMIELDYHDNALDEVTEAPLVIAETGFTGHYTVIYIDKDFVQKSYNRGYKQITVSVTTPRAQEYDVDFIVSEYGDGSGGEVDD